jgi:hypothetical protein
MNLDSNSLMVGDLEDNEEGKLQNVEEQVFKALDHHVRRDVLRYIGKKKGATFADIMSSTKIPDSPTLSYHLKTLALFVEQQDGNYHLTSIGADAYTLLLRTEDYSKLVLHMGMTMTEEEHEKWHREHPDITPEQHEAWMRKMGISREEDEEWHKTHGIREKSNSRREPINPFAVGGGFLNYCVGQGWLIQEGKGRDSKYYVTEKGEKEIRKLGIKI